MSFNGQTLHLLSGSRAVGVLSRSVAWRTPRLVFARFHVPFSGTKNRANQFIFMPDGNVFPPVICAAARYSYAYEINYVPNSSRSQSNVV